MTILRSASFYFGRKTLAVSYGGTLRLFGKKGSTFDTDALDPDPENTGTSWTRLVTNLAAKGATFDVNGVVDWEEGDHIVITSTDYLPGHVEEAIVSTVTPNGTTTTIKISGIVLDNGMVQVGEYSSRTMEPLTRFRPPFKLTQAWSRGSRDSRRGGVALA